MLEIRRKFNEEFRKNAMKLSHASPKTAKEVASDLGISETMLYRWRRLYTSDGDRSRYATLEEENKALQLQLAESRME
ncbi:MAG: transposase, partial [Synergistaceae bacterium]|nr:transposase [Synergistaceae bacterium]